MAIRTEAPAARSFHIAGEDVTIPVEVRSARMIAAQYLVPAAAAQAVIAATGLRVARLPRGKALCALSGVAYADNDLGPYNELAVAFVVEPHDGEPGARPDPRSPVTYIHRLPVNQAFTCAAGRGIWGFPKWVAEIDYEASHGATTCSVSDDEGHLLTLEVRRGVVPLPSSPVEMTSYSLDDEGVLRRTRWTSRSQRTKARPGGARLRLGDHPLAAELRSLDLPRRSIMTTSTPMMSASFGAPEVVELP